MSYIVERTHVEECVMGAIRLRAKMNELSMVIPKACGDVWNLVKEAKLEQPGRMIALYWDDEMNIEVGVEVAKKFADIGPLVCSCTPTGPVATVVHMGPYQNLPAAHQAVHEWRTQQGLKFAGPSWELYGHWDPDPAKCRTDIFYLLKE